MKETHRPINTLTTLNPTAIRATREAFEAAARALGCACGGRPATLPLEMQVCLARSIVERVRTGERDVDALRDFALASLGARCCHDNTQRTQCADASCTSGNAAHARDLADWFELSVLTRGGSR